MRKTKLLFSLTTLSTIGAMFPLASLASCGKNQPKEEHHIIEPTKEEKKKTSSAAGVKHVTYSVMLDSDTTGDRFLAEAIPENNSDVELGAVVESIEGRKLNITVGITNELKDVGNLIINFSLKITSEVYGWYQTINGYTFTYKAGELNKIVLSQPSRITLKWKVGKAILKVESHEPADAKIIDTKTNIWGNVEYNPTTGEIWLPESTGGSITFVCTDSNGKKAEATCFVDINKEVESLVISGKSNIDVDNPDGYSFFAHDEFGRSQTAECDWSVIEGGDLATIVFDTQSGTAKLQPTETGRKNGGSVTIQVMTRNTNSNAVAKATKKVELGSYDKLDTEKLSVGKAACVDNNIAGNLVIPNIYYDANEKAIPITTIQSGAFKNCSKITDVHFPKSFNTIQVKAFEGCSGLNTISIDSNNETFFVNENCLITKEGKSMYGFGGEKCVVLGCKSSTFPIAHTQIVKEIGPYVFQNIQFTNTEIKLPRNITTIHEYSFEGSNITKLIFPNEGSTDIANVVDPYAFANCKQLTEADCFYFYNWTNIENHVFDGCTSLTKFNAPTHVEKIEGNAFTNCPLTGFQMNDSLQRHIWSFSQNGGETQTWMPDDADYSQVNADFINENLKGTDKCLYKNWDRGNVKDQIVLEETSAGSDKYKIGAGDGFKTTNLVVYDKHYIGNTAKSISALSSNGFKSQTSLKSVNLENNSSITEIGSGAFDRCSHLTSVKLGGNIKKFGSNCFNKCTSLKSINFPDVITELGDHAFDGCKNLEPMDFSKVKANIAVGAYCFYNNLKIKNINFTLQENPAPHTIKESAFNHCINAEVIDLSGKDTARIGDNAFYDCINAKTIRINKYIKAENIGSGAFAISAKLSLKTPRTVYVDSADVVANANSISSSGYLFSADSQKEATQTIYILNTIADPTSTAGKYIFENFTKAASTDVPGYYKWVKKG